MQQVGRARLDGGAALGVVVWSLPDECLGLGGPELDACLWEAGLGAPAADLGELLAVADEPVWDGSEAAAVFPAAVGAYLVLAAIGTTLVAVTMQQLDTARRTGVTIQDEQGRSLALDWEPSEAPWVWLGAASVADQSTWKGMIARTILERLAEDARASRRMCEELPRAVYRGEELCEPLSFEERVVADELSTVWPTQPRALCAVRTPDQARQSECGLGEREGGRYCPYDDTILWNVRRAGELHDRGLATFATLLAHEWGHVIQHRWGLIDALPAGSSELHADCLAGVFMAVEALRGRFVAADLPGAFAYFDELGAMRVPGSKWGTAPERIVAFGLGFAEGWRRVDELCTTDVMHDVEPYCDDIGAPNDYGLR